MVINHNINSIVAYNRANAIENKKNSAMEKLSSGLRVNSAADDAAGASISEKMKAQIRGLEQAGKNIQHGISLVQTAEAGLGSIQNPNLIRMKELVEQALNGTLTQVDRTAIQAELDNIKGSIDDIANYTEFNTTKVLSPPVSEVSDPPIVQQPKLDIVFMVDNSGSMTGNITTVKNGITDFVNNLKGIADAQVAIVNLCKGSPYDIKQFETDPAKIASNFDNLAATDGTRPYEVIQKSIPGGEIGNSLSYSSGSKKVFVVFTDTDNESGISGITEDTAQNAVEGSNITNGLDDDDIQTYVFGMGGGYFPDASFDGITSYTGGKIYHPSNSTDISDKLKTDLIEDIKNSMPPAQQQPTTETDEMPIIQLQVGANAGEQFKVELFDARTHKLGINDINVDSLDNAKLALGKVEQAMEMVSKQRSKFGAYQNALEHIGNNVGNYGENMTSAQSRISDADMAKEVMEMSKDSILQESAQSMLKQSEKMSESIINLMNRWQGNIEK